ncbi:hypothetical protein NL676_005850 [Syzygium grande]|nr:hypothetical protein NL676_005850 [Syzygium grande]
MSGGFWRFVFAVARRRDLRREGRRSPGPNGSIRNKEEYSHDANAGLKIPLDFCGERFLLFLSYLPLGFSAFTVLIPLAEWCLASSTSVLEVVSGVHLFMHRLQFGGRACNCRL